jgi:hypothetical protein
MPSWLQHRSRKSLGICPATDRVRFLAIRAEHLNHREHREHGEIVRPDQRSALVPPVFAEFPVVQGISFEGLTGIGCWLLVRVAVFLPSTRTNNQ